MKYPKTVAIGLIALLTGGVAGTALAAPGDYPRPTVISVEEFDAHVAEDAARDAEQDAEIEALRQRVTALEGGSIEQPPVGETGTTVDLQVVPADSELRITGTLIGLGDGANGVIFSHGGPDQSGNAWTHWNLEGTRVSVVFDHLVNGTTYQVTAQPTKDGVPVGTPRTVTATPSGSTAPPPAGGGTSGAWRSGIVGPGDYDGSVAAWRGTPLGSATHWADSQDACQNQWGLQPGGAAAWVPAGMPTVVAIGGKWGQSWQSAATGGMDAIWTNCLNALKTHWGDRADSDLIISLFHESNGNWYEWSVRRGDLGNFKAAFDRFHTLQERIIPDAKLALVLNADHLGDYTPAEMLPDPADYDILGFDMYAMHHPAAPGEDFDDWVALAASVGKPSLVQEWATADDDIAFVEYMHANMVQHGGTGPGKVEIENYFNLWEGYHIYPTTTTQSPNAARRYAELF